MRSLLLKWLTRERPNRQFPLSDFERISHELRQCDVLLVEGRSRVSDYIRWLTSSPWTHAALYIGRIHDVEDEDVRDLIRKQYKGEDSDRLVVESLMGQGTVVRNLEVYRDYHVRISRPARISHTDAQKVVRYAASRVGVDYDIRQIFDLFRFLAPWEILPKRWASTLFAPEGSRRMKTVCSTMIAEAFGYVQFPILPLVKRTQSDKVQLFRRNPRLCTPSDFDYSPYFEIIKYSFIDFYHEEYHLLPWKGPNMLSGEEADLYAAHAEPDVDEVEQAIADGGADEKNDEKKKGED